MTNEALLTKAVEGNDTNNPGIINLDSLCKGYADELKTWANRLLIRLNSSRNEVRPYFSAHSSAVARNNLCQGEYGTCEIFPETKQMGFT